MPGREHLLFGREYLAAVVELLHRVRDGDPIAGAWEAADLEWWWRKPRPTDDSGQLFWLVDDRPVAAAVMTDWGPGRIGLDVIALPTVPEAVVAHLVEQGAGGAGGAGASHLESLVDDKDERLAAVLHEAGFVQTAETGTSAWMSASSRPAVAPLADGYRLVARTDLTDRPHHLIERNGPAVERRLRETSLYRPDLDLAVLDQAGEIAAYGLFWLDPTTGVGLVEPMRTEDEHQRRGLAWHVVTAGADRLATLGATRVKIGYENDNPASGPLYRSVGFTPTTPTSLYLRRHPTDVSCSS